MGRQRIMIWKTRWIMVINLILLTFILLILYSRYNKKQVVIDINRGSEPREFIEVLSRNNLQFSKRLEMLFVFTKRPTLSSLENIDKLYHKYEKKDVDFCAVFMSRFRLPSCFHFPHRFLAKYKFVYRSSFHTLNNPACVLLLKENKIIYVDNILELSRLAKILAWQVNPDSSANDIKFSKEDFRLMLLDKMKKNDIRLLDIYTRGIYSSRSVLLSDIDQIYVIHAACASCELRRLLSNLVEMQKKNNIVIIFSVLSNSYELMELLGTWRTHLNAYIDYYDELGLLPIEMSDEYSLICFNLREIL